MIDSEETLVRKAQRGDRSAFEALVSRTARLVFARLYLETGNRHLSEDLLQETLLAAYRSLGELTEPSRFRAWILRIAVNRAIDYLRRDHRHQKLLESGELYSFPEQPTPVQQLEQQELHQKTLEILRTMPEAYRLPLTMRYLTGADYKTIQVQMGLSNGSLRGLLQRGMKKLREELTKITGEEKFP